MSETEKIENVESTPKQDEATLREAEKQEEAKLKAKYPQVMRPGGSLFLQKRLHRGQKYFDSGDYNMAKAKDQKIRPPVAPPIATPQSATTGDEIPTPDAVLNRKTSLVQSKLATGLS